MTKNAAQTSRRTVVVPRRGSKGPAATAVIPSRAGVRFGPGAERMRERMAEPLSGYSTKRLHHVGLQTGIVGRWRVAAARTYRRFMTEFALELISKASAVAEGREHKTIFASDLIYAYPHATAGRRFFTSGGDTERAFVPHKVHAAAAAAAADVPAPPAKPAHRVAHKAPRSLKHA